MWMVSEEPCLILHVSKILVGWIVPYRYNYGSLSGSTRRDDSRPGKPVFVFVEGAIKEGTGD